MTPDLLPSLLLLDPQRRRGQKAQPAVASSSPPPLPLPAAAPPCSSRTPPPCGWTTTPERHAAVNSDAPGPVRVIDGNDDRRERHLREVVVGGRRAAADGRRRRRRRRAPRRAQDPLDARPSFCLLKAVSSAFSPFQPERWHEQSNCVSIERTHSANCDRSRMHPGSSALITIVFRRSSLFSFPPATSRSSCARCCTILIAPWSHVASGATPTLLN